MSGKQDVLALRGKSDLRAVRLCQCCMQADVGFDRSNGDLGGRLEPSRQIDFKGSRE